MHCASVGEFEQGRPVLEALRDRQPDRFILVTFFSPSGYELRKNYAGADGVLYLPLDGPRTAAQFLDLVRPDRVIFVKYEFWYYYLREIARRNIPLHLISAVFRPGQAFFQWYGGFHRQMLNFFDDLFVQDARSAELLRSLDLPDTRVHLAGDTRLDRVRHIAQTAQSLPSIDRFADGHLLLIAGSTWPPDIAVLRELAAQPEFGTWKLIVAPHEIDEAQLQRTERSFPVGSVVRFSELPSAPSEHRVLLIDNIGMLASLYRYGRIAYVGGAFGSGLHNILEPAAHGLPVLFGPKYHKFNEARELLARSGVASIGKAEELIAQFRRWQQEEAYAKAVRQIEAYFAERSGATKVIVAALGG